MGSLKYNASVLPSTAIDNKEGMAMAVGERGFRPEGGGGGYTWINSP